MPKLELAVGEAGPNGYKYDPNRLGSLGVKFVRHGIVNFFTKSRLDIRKLQPSYDSPYYSISNLLSFPISILIHVKRRIIRPSMH